MQRKRSRTYDNAFGVCEVCNVDIDKLNDQIYKEILEFKKKLKQKYPTSDICFREIQIDHLCQTLLKE